LRYRTLRRDGFRCIFCGRGPRDVELQVDHLWPVAKGGGNEEWNLATCCQPCNSGKRAQGEGGFEARYRFLQTLYASIADATPEERRHFENINRKVIESPLLWMDYDAIEEALASIQFINRQHLFGVVQ
jgi:hypothetical protein